MMHDFYRTVGHYFCCIPSYRSPNDTNAASLSTLHLPASTVSVALPQHTVPHSSSESFSQDAKALQHIFSSSSSVRGYQTAATTPGYEPISRPSLDRDFKFGSSDLAKKPSGPIEKLGNHIRQKLSESRLSKASSKHDVQVPPDLAKEDKTKHLQEQATPLGISHSTAGLTDLLASRNASKGGYDSDAKSITTPMMRSNAGTIKVSGGFVKQVLNNIESIDDDRDATPRPKPAANLGEDQKSIHMKAITALSPSTPRKTSFIEALQIGANESPSDVLRRLSVGLARGNMRMPATPEMLAMRLSDLNNDEDAYRLSAPRRSSSLKKDNIALLQHMKQLSEKIDTALKQDSSGADRDNNRSSLISELEPDLVDYMMRHAERLSSEAGEYHENTGKPSLDTIDILPHLLQDDAQPEPNTAASRTDLDSLAEGDMNSVHLFNMRISQHLASHSQLPTLSPTTSNDASARSTAPPSAMASTLNVHLQGPPIPRYPTWIGTEHNRRPSDPQTRQLFEADASRRDLGHTWKTVTTVNSGPSSEEQLLAKPKHLPRDDASSYYWSDGENGNIMTLSPPAVSRPGSSRNPHSLAVGGRSLSASMPESEPNDKVSHASSIKQRSTSHHLDERPRASEDSWQAPAPFQAHMRGRSASVPHKRSHRPEPSPTPVSKRYRENTSIAENLSEVSLARVFDRRNEKVTEVTPADLQDRRNEKFSEIDFTGSGGHDTSRLKVPKYNNSTLGQRQRKSRSSTGQSADNPADGRAPDPAVTECATNQWQRAFQHARGDDRAESRDGFLKAPQFDREGRRRSTNTSLSVPDAGQRGRSRSLSPFDSATSPSARDSQRASSSVDLDRHVKLCATARGPLPRTVPLLQVHDHETQGKRASIMRDKTKIRKKSLLDLGRRFTSAGVPSEDERHGSSPNLKGRLGIWAKFPSHNRSERNGTATDRDGVGARDFVSHHASGFMSLPQSRVATPGLGSPPSSSLAAPNGLFRFPPSMRKRLDKAKSRSMTLRSKHSRTLTPFDRVKKGRKGLLEPWKKLYRSSSSDIRKYAYASGHRSSLSVSDTPKDPDLECLPGEGLLRHSHDQSVGASYDGTRDASMEACQSETRVKISTEAAQMARQAVPLDGSEWGRFYGDCVGSLSALKSETDVANTQPNDGSESRKPNTKDIGSMELRESTTNFQRRLGIEQEKAREDLMGGYERLEKNTDDNAKYHEDVNQVKEPEPGPVVLSKRSSRLTITPTVASSHLRMPGSFED